MSRHIVSRATALVLGTLVADLVIVGGLTWECFTAAGSARMIVFHTYDVMERSWT